MSSESSDVPDAVSRPLRSVRVCIVSDIRIHREGLAAALDRAADIEVVGMFGSDQAVTGALSEISPAPDVIVVDLPPTTDRLALVALVPASRMVAVGVGDSEPEIVACAESGMSGYVDSEASIDELLQVVRSVLRDELVCSPRVAAKLFRRLGAPTDATRVGEGATLTRRECQVLSLIRDGLANKEIAKALGISESTVKNHVHHLLEKLKVRRRLQAARMDAASAICEISRRTSAWPVRQIG